MTTPATFRKADVTRALKAAVAAGLDVVRVDFPPRGGFAIVTSKSHDDDGHNEWDDDDA